MSDAFHQAIIQAFSRALDDADWGDLLLPRRHALCRQLMAHFTEHLSVVLAAHNACEGGNQADARIRDVVVNSVISEMERAYLARHDWVYARERAYAIWQDFTKPRLF